jgi:hypothetical protein
MALCNAIQEKYEIAQCVIVISLEELSTDSICSGVNTPATLCPVGLRKNDSLCRGQSQWIHEPTLGGCVSWYCHTLMDGRAVATPILRSGHAQPMWKSRMRKQVYSFKYAIKSAIC